ncbi:MAG: ATP phosphoribosyltransferase regulatory subunit, partial [Candidatus Bathyarchaeia archaeon]
MPYQPPRGTFDVLPREMVGRNIVIEKIRGVIEKYGYEPMDTPAFESWRLLEVKCGEDIKEQIYRFEDKKGRELGLRYDLTVPLARVIASNPQLPKPFKRYSISRVWRYEKPTASRRREFLQCDADIVGSSEPLSDAEVIALGAECLKTLGLATLLVRLNNRKVLEGLLELAKIDAKKKLDVFRAMDKLAKIGRNGVLEELRRIGVPALPSRRLLDLMGKRGEPTEVLTHARR